MPLKRTFKRKVAAKKPTLKKLEKKIAKVSLRDRPVYKVYDDVFNDPAYGGTTLSVDTTPRFKYVGYEYYGQSNTTTSGLVAGVNEGQLVGNKIMCVSLTMRGQLFIIGSPITSPDFTNTVRLIVYWDNGFSGETSGGTPANRFPTQGSEILGSFTGNPSPATPGVFAGYNIGYVGKNCRYKPLWDRTFTFSSQGNAVHKIHHKIKLRKFMNFSNINDIAGTSGGAYPTQGIGMMFMSDSGSLPHPICVMQFRLCYY